MSHVKLSIITINYNNLDGLRKTFESIFKQSSQDFEYIVIDGYSKDGSREFIEKNENRISSWISEPDLGIYNALNKGLQRATGEYVLCLNSGDFLYSESTVSQVLPQLSSTEDLIYGDTWLVHSSDKKVLYTLPEVLNFDFFYKGSLSHPATFVKKSLHEKFGLYDESLKIVSDWKFFLKALSSGAVTYKKIDQCISYFDKNGISSTRSDILQQERSHVLNRDYSFFLPNLDQENKPTSLSQSVFNKIKKFIKLILPYGVVVFIQNRNK